MVLPPRYATVQDLRDRGITVAQLSDDDAVDALDEVSRWVEEYTQQIFYPLSETVYIDGQLHRLLHHPDLFPILSDEDDITVTEQVTRSRDRTSEYVIVGDTYELDTDDFSLRTRHPRRYIDKTAGAWNEGSHNYAITATWGWMSPVYKTEYTIASDFETDDTELELTSVAGLRKKDVGVLEDGTVLIVTDVDKVTKTATVEGSDLQLTSPASAGQTFTRWGRVPQGIRDFVVEAIYQNTAGSSGSGSCGWIRRERTDTYEYEKFTPDQLGMDGGGWFTGNLMIDQGLTQYRKPMYIGVV